MDGDASSCGEMVYRLFKKMKVPISKADAMAMYVAILTDTGSFRYSNTAPETHRIAAELMEIGVNATEVASNIYESFSPGRFKLLCRVLSEAEISPDGKIVSMMGTGEMFKETKTGQRDTEDFINFGRFLKEALVVVFFREEDGCCHVSFRSKGDIDVNKIASGFGGGGHRNASGCIVKGILKAAKKEVLKKVEDFLNNAK